MFRLKIETGNAAFEGSDKWAELARILRVAAARVENGMNEGRLFDINGNTVGTYSLVGRQ